MSNTSFTEEQERFIQTLVDVENKGGSAGYKSHPENFQSFAEQVLGSNIQDDHLVESLEQIKSISPSQQATDRFEIVQARVKSHSDPVISALSPKFQATSAGSSAGLESLVKDVRAAIAARKISTKEFNILVQEVIQGIESLGGSKGYKQHLSNQDAKSRPAFVNSLIAKRVQVRRPADVSSASGNGDKHWCPGDLQVSYFSGLGRLKGGCKHVGCRGYFWETNLHKHSLVPGKIQGTQFHRKPENVDGKDSKGAIDVNEPENSSWATFDTLDETEMLDFESRDTSIGRKGLGEIWLRANAVWKKL